MKIQMFHRIKGIPQLYPPVLGTEHLPNWVERVRQDFSKLSKEDKDERFSILKCPGIFELFNKGFYVPLPYDIEFTVKEDSQVQYTHPSFKPNVIPADVYDETRGYFEQEMSVVIHDEVVNNIPIRKGTFKGVVNVKTGWSIISPVPLLFLPIPYPDQYEYEASMGILDTKKNSDVNAQLYMNYVGKEARKYKISAGEQIMFIVPLTNDKWELDARDLTKKDKLWLDSMYLFKSGWSSISNQSFFRFSSCPFSKKKEKFKLFDKFWK